MTTKEKSKPTYKPLTLPPVVVRTNRGLSIAGTRITLYQIMDYLKAGESWTIIQEHFRLTFHQVDEVKQYIETHAEEFEAEYKRIVSQAEENRRYWEDYNKERFARIATQPRKPEHKAIWKKLDAQKKARLAHHDKNIS